MLIETNPCDQCDCVPDFCDGDIEICMLTRGNARPLSEEEYIAKKDEEYMRQYNKQQKAEIRLSHLLGI